MTASEVPGYEANFFRKKKKNNFKILRFLLCFSSSRLGNLVYKKSKCTWVVRDMLASVYLKRL